MTDRPLRRAHRGGLSRDKAILCVLYYQSVSELQRRRRLLGFNQSQTRGWSVEGT